MGQPEADIGKDVSGAEGEAETGCAEDGHDRLLYVHLWRKCKKAVGPVLSHGLRATRWLCQRVMGTVLPSPAGGRQGSSLPWPGVFCAPYRSTVAHWYLGGDPGSEAGTSEHRAASYHEATVNKGDSMAERDGSTANHPGDLAGFEYRCVGPHRGGRVVAVAGHPTDPMTFYFGACAGGVWKTTDGGTFWENISDGFLTTAAVGAIQISESDPNVIFAGTGETTIRGNVSHGDGVYRSTDGGKTWQNMGLRDTRHIAKIRIHPQNPDVVYVAALGHAWGPNEERGVFRSRDGGQTWEKMLYRDENTGTIDLSIDPHNPRILYAAFWQARRYPWKLEIGGPEI